MGETCSKNKGDTRKELQIDGSEQEKQRYVENQINSRFWGESDNKDGRIPHEDIKDAILNDFTPDEGVYSEDFRKDAGPVGFRTRREDGKSYDVRTADYGKDLDKLKTSYSIEKSFRNRNPQNQQANFYDQDYLEYRANTNHESDYLEQLHNENVNNTNRKVRIFDGNPKNNRRIEMIETQSTQEKVEDSKPVSSCIFLTRENLDLLWIEPIVANSFEVTTGEVGRKISAYKDSYDEGRKQDIRTTSMEKKEIIEAYSTYEANEKAENSFKEQSEARPSVRTEQEMRQYADPHTNRLTHGAYDARYVNRYSYQIVNARADAQYPHSPLSERIDNDNVKIEDLSDWPSRPNQNSGDALIEQRSEDFQAEAPNNQVKELRRSYALVNTAWPVKEELPGQGQEDNIPDFDFYNAGAQTTNPHFSADQRIGYINIETPLVQKNINTSIDNVIKKLPHRKDDTPDVTPNRWPEENYRDVKQVKTYEKKGKYIYTGEFLNNKFEGQGKKVFTNGNVFEGEFKNGKEEGNGVLQDAYDNILMQGVWVNGEYRRN